MTATLTIFDETMSGHTTYELTLDFLTEHITVRELIRSRVYQEVQDFNLRKDNIFNGLVQPTESEVTLNGFRLKERRQIDWQRQYEKAVEAFEATRIIVLIDDKQAESIEQMMTTLSSAQIPK